MKWLKGWWQCLLDKHDRQVLSRYAFSDGHMIEFWVCRRCGESNGRDC